jgi:DHA3 family macrolide efflux protein-like MFS transporter
MEGSGGLMQGKVHDALQNNWKIKAFIFLSSQLMSQFGSAVVGFAVVWYITLETGSSSLMTISILSTFIPQIIIALFAGVWADRYNRKFLIIFSDLLTASATLVLVIYFLSGHESFTLIFIISAIRSVGAGIQMPAVGAILPQIVPMDKLTRVNGINSALGSGMMLISPAVAGIVLGTFGFGYTLLLDVITALLAVVILTFLRVRKQKVKISLDSEGNPQTGIFLELKEGLSYTRNHPFIRRLLIIYAVFFFMVTPAAFLTPIMIARSFGPEVWRLTANEIFWTGGALLGGALIAFRGSFKDKIKTLAISSMGFGITFMLLGFSTNFTFYLAVMFIAGIFMPYFGTAETVLLQENVEEHMLGRVYSIVQIIVSAVMPLGMLIFGPLGDSLRIETILIASGVGVLALTPYIWRTKIGKGEENHESEA